METTPRAGAVILRQPTRSRLGFGLLGLAVVLVIVMPVTFVTILVGALATAVLAFDRRYGPLPAALLVMLALPYDRAADVFLPEIGGIPLRVQDGVIATGVILALPRIRSVGARLRDADGRLRPIVAIVGLFLALGVIALAVGFLSDNAARDILRDTRWWILYAVVPLALVTGTRWTQIVRAVLVGTTIFAGLLVVAAVLPAFEQAVKFRALLFDPGLLRLQFGNTTFLLVALAYVTWTAIRRPSPRRWAWLILLATAGGLSLTRTFILVAAGVVALVIVAVLVSRRRPIPRPRLTAAGGAAVVAAVGIVLGIGVSTFGATVTAFSPGFGSRTNTGQSALERLLFQSPGSDVSALGGRFETYRDAAEIIAARPVLGGGLGTLVEIDYRFGAGEFDTPGFLPNVDDAYLTVGMKAGIVGIVLFGLLVLVPLVNLVRARRATIAVWLLPAWLGVLGLTVTQSFATTGYGPYAVGLLLVIPSLAYPSRRAFRARAPE